ncbi:synaptogyrin-3 [Crocuta crocuta]
MTPERLLWLRIWGESREGRPVTADRKPAPGPSPPSLSPGAPPPPAAGWGDVTGLGAPTCGRGRGGRRPPLLRSASDPYLSPRSVFLVLTTWKRAQGRGRDGRERSSSARGGGCGSVSGRASTCFSPTHILQAPPKGTGPFPGPPVAIVFSIAVFGPIVNEGYVNTDSGPELRCVFNGNAGACRFGVALGLGAFLACAAFLLLDVRFQQISSVRDRRRAVLLDLGFSGLWSFLWFVGFCFLTNQWQRTAPGPGTLQAGDAARAAIAFSFFSILSWVALTVKALQRFRLGTDMSLFATEQLGAGAGQAYPGYPVGSGVEGTETYQSPPFTETLDTSPKGYQVPAY